MKKLAGIILAVAFVFTLGTVGVLAAPGHRNACGRTVRTTTCQFVDDNQDGICDNYPNGDTHRHDRTGKRGGHGCRW